MGSKQMGQLTDLREDDSLGDSPKPSSSRLLGSGLPSPGTLRFGVPSLSSASIFGCSACKLPREFAYAGGMVCKTNVTCTPKTELRWSPPGNCCRAVVVLCGAEPEYCPVMATYIGGQVRFRRTHFRKRKFTFETLSCGEGRDAPHSPEAKKKNSSSMHPLPGILYFGV